MQNPRTMDPTLSPPANPHVTGITRDVLVDVEDQARSLAGWGQRYQQLSGGHFRGSMLGCSVDGLQFFVESLNQSTHQTGPGPAGAIALAFPLVCEGAGRVFGQTYDRDTLVALGPRQASDFRSPATLQLAGIAIEADELLRYAAWSDREAAVTAAVSRAVLSLAPASSARLRRRLHAAARLVAGEPAALQREVVQTLRHTLLSAFVEAVDLISAASAAPALRPLPTTSRSRHRIVREAVEFMRASVDQPLGMVDVCAAVRVQARVLQYGFNEAFGVTPMAFLRGLRLHGIRRELRASTEEPIGDIAARWGLWHLSRLAADYRALFGELPSATRRRRASSR
ncbi:helix-turn-helix domain-containing protein [Roseateles chitinivorans]|uniref:helix-turn-helix domain-containing protein n=1 Tax=Roseateles chitinivorans TaxID=2917965 RepID=UPI003D669D88